MFLVGEWETVPFHFVWVSLTIMYGFRVWSPASTAVTLVVTCIVMTIGIVFVVGGGTAAPAELAEVPLMALMFVAMVWHARRRQAALEELERSRESEREFVRNASHQLR